MFKFFWKFFFLVPFFLLADEAFISSNSIQDFCDVVVKPLGKKFEAQNVKDGDIIYVEGCIFHHFYKQEKDKIKNKYILITHGSDASMPGDYKDLLDDANLIVWFAQNVNETHPKLKYLPIGIDRIAETKERYLFILKNLKKSSVAKTHLLFMNFRTCTNPKERNLVYKTFEKKPFCFTTKYQKDVDVFLADLAASKFVLSPRGGGMDCYRTWEALYLNTIPVMTSCPLDPVYEGLPVLIVEDWSQITEEFLEKKYLEFSEKKFDLEKLTVKYWYDLIDSYRSCYR